MASTRSEILCQQFTRALSALAAELDRSQHSLVPHSETIHRIRVQTRRLQGLLQWCQPKSRGRAIAVLKKIRQRAGPLRDADVILAQIHASIPKSGNSCWSIFIGACLGHRLELAAIWKRQSRALKRKTACMQTRLVQCCRNEKLEPLGKSAGQHLLIRRLESIKHCQLPQSSGPALHDLRIAGKKLRYVLEAFPGKLSPAWNSWLAWLQALQKELGHLHDQQVLLDRLHSLANFDPQGLATRPFQWKSFVKSRQSACNKRINLHTRQLLQIWKRMPQTPAAS